MNASDPPTLATWLLRTLGSGPHLDAIVGDLRERFQAHPSGFWFWRQVLQTIIITALEESASHKLVAVRAVVVGWLALGTALELLNFLQYTLSVVANGGVEVAGYWIVLPTSYYSWVYRYGQYVTLGTMAIAGLVSGWIVRRFHSGPMLLAFSAFVLVWAFTSWTLDPSRGRAPAVYLLTVFTVPLCILCGGIIAAGLRRSASRLVPAQSEDFGSAARPEYGDGPARHQSRSIRDFPTCPRLIV